MSSFESSNSSEEEVTMYRCRHCPGCEFTATERDLHREQHKRQRDRTGSRGVRGSSPTITLFEKIPVRDEDSSIAESTPRRTSPRNTRGPQQARKTPKKPSSKKPAKKDRRVRSEKNYARHVKPTINNGG